MFPTNPKDMQEYCNTHDIDELTVPEFVFYSGPMMATNSELFDTLDTLCYKCMYYLPFKYIGFFRTLAKKATAKQLKAVMRDMTNDLDEYEKYYQANDPSFNKDNFAKLCKAIKDYLASLLQDIRQYQKENGVFESVVTNYAPVISYTSTVKKQSLAGESAFYALVDSRMNTLYNYLIEYKQNPSSFPVNAMGMLMDCVNGVIAYQAIAYTEVHSLHDSFRLMASDSDGTPYEVLLYWGYVCGCIYAMKEEYSDMTMILDSYRNLIGANGKLTDSDYAAIFESLMPHNASSDELAIEATLPDVDTANGVPDVNDTPPIPEVDKSVIDIDRVRTILAGMRYISINQVANQQFLEHVGTDISNYSYIGDDKQTIVAQIRGCSCIPYSDIADDHKLKVLVIQGEGHENEHYSIPIEEFINNWENNAFPV